MADNYSATASRPTLGFTFEDVSAHDSTLFKALVRLLDHRTEQRWVHEAAQPDVRVIAETGLVGTEPETQDCLIGTGPQPLRLILSPRPDRRPHYLGLPLRADALEAELNDLGAQRLRAQIGMAPAPQAWSAADTLVRLLRWPPAELLSTAQRVRLATLLVSKPVTLAWVQKRSGVTPAECAQFFAELHDAGLIVSMPPANGASAAKATVAPSPSAIIATTPMGLFTRIRNRLGLLVRSPQP
ncbi:MAG TPA: hypothetical protein VGC24_11585 [Burkholderiaceae bacterium]